MADLFNIRHEIDLSEYDSIVTDGGDLSQGSPGLANTAGRMELLINDTTNIYGLKAVAIATNNLRYRFYLDPNGLAIDAGDGFYLCIWNASGIDDKLLHTLHNIGGTYTHYVYGVDDEGGWKGVSGTITDAPHYLEVALVRETGDGNNDGTLTFWVDGVQQGTRADIGNFNEFQDIDSVEIGAPSGLDANTLGTFYLDEFRANDDGSEIGPVAQVPVFRRRMEGY